MKIVFYFFILVIFVFSFIPNLGINTYPFENADKLKHIIAFFTLSLLFYSSFKELEPKTKFYILVLFAFILEVVQSYVGREASFFDFLASFVGIILFLLIKKVILENKKFT